MSLVQTLNEHMKDAMKSKDKMRLSVIRMVKASLQNEAIRLGVDNLSEEEELTILARELKQRNESITEFSTANREDLVEQLNAEIKILQTYMPAPLSEEELESIVKETIVEVNATSKKDFGKVMGSIMPKVKGKADGSHIQKLVHKFLS